MALGFACAQPGEVLALHAAHLIGIDAELLDPVLPRVGGRRVHRETEPASPALVVRRGQNESRLTLAQLIGDGQRVEQQELVAELDRVRRDILRPRPVRLPVGMRCTPVPETGPKLTHGA